MKVRLIRDSRINHKAGEIVEVSPAEAEFLLSVQSAAFVPETQGKTQDEPQEQKTKVKRNTKK